MYGIYGVISYVLYVQQQFVCGCIGSSESLYFLCRSSCVADLIRQDQTH